MPEWRLRYGDGSTFDSDDGEWQDAPYRNVQFLLTPDEKVGREIDHGRDFYIWWPGAAKPWSVDFAGLLDYLKKRGDIAESHTLASLSLQKLKRAGVKLGRSIGNREYEALMKEAVRDPDFPPKSG